MTTAAGTMDYRHPQTRTHQPPARGTTVLVALLVAATLLTGGMRWLVQAQREDIQPRPCSQSRVSGLDSFALGLILGGLRGPLVMVLWTTTENQKSEKNLEDIDSRIELIRMLQPEFDSVHIFQMWNKAYNLSVQMASLPSKYSTILDALNYGHSVDAERPDNVNILVAKAEIYLNKLGGAQEKKYYRARVRAETLEAAKSGRDQKRGDRGWRPTRHEVMLDSKGFILPKYRDPPPLARTIGPKAGATGETYNGAELQFLAAYNTPEMGGFPYGLSPLAIASSYYKRSAVLMANTGQDHLQMTDAVVDSRGAIALKQWGEEEWERARLLEIQALGKSVPTEPNWTVTETRLAMENVTADVAPDAKFTESGERAKKIIDEALFSYRRASQTSDHARTEYERHVRNVNFSGSAEQYRSHIDTVAATSLTNQADLEYLTLLAHNNGIRPLSTEQVQSTRQAAIKRYEEAKNAWYLMIFKYYLEDEVALIVYPAVTEKELGKKLDKATIGEADPRVFPVLLKEYRAYLKANNRQEYSSEDIREYETYIQRMDARLKFLK